MGRHQDVGGTHVHAVEGHDVVEYAERSSLRRGDEVVVFDREIGDGDDRQVELQRLPLHAVVRRVLDADLGSANSRPLRVDSSRIVRTKLPGGCRTRPTATSSRSRPS